MTQDDPNHSDDHNRLANLLHASSTGTGIYDVLYAGAANQAFPSGNLWQWPFGNGDGGGDGGGPGGVP